MTPTQQIAAMTDALKAMLAHSCVADAGADMKELRRPMTAV